jgi:hypothetical protein
MIRSFRVAAAIAAISLSACNPPKDTRQQAGRPEVQTFQSIGLQSDLNYTDAEIIRDKEKGCEYVIFTVTRGASVLPRMEADGNGGERQAGCRNETTGEEQSK